MLRNVPSIPTLVRVFNHEWMLDFVKCFFCIYSDDHMVTTFALSIPLLIFRLFLCLGYCKYCCIEHWGVCIFQNQVFFFQIHAQEWECWIIWQLYFLVCQGNSILFSTVAVPVYIPTNRLRGFPFLYTLSSIYYLQTF